MEGSFGAGPLVPGSRIDTCISCYKPETVSAMVVVGDIDWLAASLNVFAGIPTEEANATAEEIYQDYSAERNQTLVRLCRDCAKKTGVPVHNVDKIETGMELRAVTQPDNI